MASIIQSAHSPCLRQLPARHTTTASKLMLHASFHGCRRPCISISSASARLGGPVRAKAAVSAADSPVTSGLENGSGNSSSDKVLLEVRGLTAVIAETRQKILKGVNLIIREGEVHAIMRKNGSGKSTFAKTMK